MNETLQNEASCDELAIDFFFSLTKKSAPEATLESTQLVVQT